MEDFTTLKIKKSIANTFREFSRQLSKPQSEVLRAMLYFFEVNLISPYENLGPKLQRIGNKVDKRTDAIIAIMKSIEKSQNISLVNIETMLNSLFQEEVKKYDPKLLQTKSLDESKSKISKEKKGVSQIEFNRTRDKLLETKDRLRYILEQIEPVKNRLGKDYLRINIPREQLARFKQALKNE